MVGYVRKINCIKFNSKTIRCRNYAKYDHVKMCKELKEINWEPLYAYTDVNAACCFIKDKLTTVFNRHAPFIEKRVKDRFSSWLLSEIRQQMNNRDKALTKARKTNNIFTKLYEITVQTPYGKQRRNVIKTFQPRTAINLVDFGRESKKSYKLNIKTLPLVHSSSKQTQTKYLIPLKFQTHVVSFSQMLLQHWRVIQFYSKTLFSVTLRKSTKRCLLNSFSSTFLEFL